MPEELQDNQKEQFVASGEAPNVLTANENAWQALESCLGRDPAEAWHLTKLTHNYVERARIEWTATFTRDPDVETPPISAEEAFNEVSDEEFREFRQAREER